MANYLPSVLVDAIGIMTERFNAKELRKPFYGAHELYVKGREFAIPDLAEIRLSENRTTTAKYLAKNTPAVGSSRSCSPSANFGDSGTVDLTWTTYSVPVKTSDKMFRNNYFSQAQQLANDLYNAYVALHNSIETAMVAHLETNKTGVNSGSAWMGTFDGTNDIFEIDLANKNDYYNFVRTVMREHNYSGELHLVQNISAMAIMDYQRAQGSGNSANLLYNYPDMMFYETNSVTAGSDHRIISYVGEANSVGVLDWIPGVNRQGLVKGDVEWATIADMFGYFPQLSLFKKFACADTTSTGGATQDPTETWELSVDLALVKAPITASDEEPIYKFGLKTS